MVFTGCTFSLQHSYFLHCDKSSLTTYWGNILFEMEWESGDNLALQREFNISVDINLTYLPCSPGCLEQSHLHHPHWWHPDRISS